MSARRPPSPGARRRLRWDRIAIGAAILILAFVFWWGVISLVLHRLVLPG
jgi:hypothetical protein